MSEQTAIIKFDNQRRDAPRREHMGSPASPRGSEAARKDLRTRRLFSRYRKTGDSLVRDSIFSEYEDLVRYWARHYEGSVACYDDLYQEGCIGLLTAIERFDLGRRIRFRTFAPYYIKGAMRQYYREKTWRCSVPRFYKDASLRIRLLSDELGHDPTRQEVVEHLDIPEEKVDDAIAATKLWKPVLLSDLDRKPSRHGSIIEIGAFRDERFDALFERVDIWDLLQRTLSPLELAAVKMYYYDDRPQHEIADRLGTYQMMVFRLIRRSLDKLGRALEQEETLRAS